jgi:hypothetical protein
MIAGTVWTQLVKTLEGNPTLSKYIKKIFEGRRLNLEPDVLPCIMLEPVGNNETVKEINNVKDVYLSVELYAFSSNNFNEFPKTIVGGVNYKGILDIEHDIIGCLEDSSTLGDRVIDIDAGQTVFDQIDTDKYPVRGMLIPLKILYRQINNE